MGVRTMKNSNLKRLRECLVVNNTPQTYQKLDSIPENLKECVENSHRRLRESAELSQNSLIKTAVHLKESLESDSDKQLLDEIIAELKKNKTVKNDQSLWKFPVARINTPEEPNGNGRAYTLPLWKNVVENQRDIWQGGVGLADHPIADDDPGEFKTSAIIWYDMMIDEANKLIWAIGSFVGTYGRLAQEIIEKGGKVGFSTSGFGEMMRDGVTVNPDTYQIERVADIVTNPSQSVYGLYTEAPHEKIDTNIEYSKQRKEPQSETAEEDQSLFEESKTRSQIVDAVKLQENIKDMKTEDIEDMKESKAEEKEVLNESATNKEKEEVKLEESKIAENEKSVKTPLSPIEKSIIFKYTENLTSEAEKIKKPTDRLKEVTKILKMVEEQGDDELRAKVLESLVAAKENLEKLAEQAADISEEFGDLDALKENVKDITKQGLLLNEQVKDYKVLAEALTESNRKLKEENKKLALRQKLKENAKKHTSMREANVALAAEKKIDALREQIEGLKKDNAELSQRLDESGKANRHLMDKNDRISSRLDISKSRFDETNADLKAKYDESIEENKRLSEENSRLNEKIKSLKEGKSVSSFNENELSESLDVAMEELKRLREEYASATQKFNDANAQLVESNKKIEVLLKNNDRLATSNKMLREKTQGIASEFAAYKEDQKIENHLEKPFESQVGSQLNFRENRGIEVENYWQSLRENYGDAVLPYERQIRFAKTYREAFGNFLKYKEAIDSSFGEYEDARVDLNVKGSARRNALKEAGMPMGFQGTTEEINDLEYERMKAKGFI